MARIPQPREVAELKGATKKHPERYRKTAPKSAAPVGKAPKHLDALEVEAWGELLSYIPVGVVTGADRLILETTAVLLSQFRVNREEFPAAKLGHLIGCLARLGLTPADRQKLGTEKQNEENPFNSF